MLMDCSTCPVRGVRCDDCVVTALLAPGSLDLPLDQAERQAVGVFVAAGLVRPEQALSLRARREPWGTVRAVG